ncbi:hypothetical protein [Campylobacter jejuni]|nr:hypothetical protein [Campylobacter jejuni]EGM0233808.1 hypothetical protein [Campylobacter jejuni]ELG0235987.1 hypothetical protein [Campylobacter jejuni]ELL7917068.1 hypothetical protein [Campylobacter jejuni]ELR1781110.1 hypothetical protein [Campylobacter jejuni]EME2729449.1 hypothetical protein [Campylobacter jejuni]
MSMWKINRQETEATSTNLVNINNKKVEFATKNNANKTIKNKDLEK